MRLTNCFLFAFVICFASTSGCGTREATVAPRTQDEIEAYKADAYGAEEESQAEAAAAEGQ